MMKELDRLSDNKPRVIFDIHERLGGSATNIAAFGITVILLITLSLLVYAMIAAAFILIYIGYLLLGLFVFSIICGYVWLGSSTLRHATKRTPIEVGEFGVLTVNTWGRITAHSPLNPVQRQLNRARKRVNELVSIPSFSELIGLAIMPGMTEMIYGYDKGTGDMVKGPWPNTAILSGMGRSGKTRRMIFLICQAIFSGARVTICDPHAEKRDGLLRVLEPLAPWLYKTAKTHQEIEDATREFRNEMYLREQHKSMEELADRHYIPRIIIFDEWNLLMSELDEDATEELSVCVQKCSQQYAGVDGFALVCGQEWTNDGAGSRKKDGTGGAKLRRVFHSAFVHTTHIDYAKWILSNTRWAKIASELPQGDCVFRDTSRVYHLLSTPFVDDQDIYTVVEILSEFLPGGIAHTSAIKAGYTPGHKTLHGGATRFLAAPVENIPVEDDHYTFDNEIELAENSVAEYGNTGNEPVEPGEDAGMFPMNGEEKGQPGEVSHIIGEGFSVEIKEEDITPPAGYTADIENMILIAALDMEHEKVKPTRTGIQKRLKWNNHQYEYIKYCGDTTGRF
jgi:hypothetical protein